MIITTHFIPPPMHNVISNTTVIIFYFNVVQDQNRSQMENLYIHMTNAANTR